MEMLHKENYETLCLENDIYVKLLEAEREAELTHQRFSSDDVRKAINNILSANKTNHSCNSALSTKES